jgi:choline dehydrogenase-like flavoprotein
VLQCVIYLKVKLKCIRILFSLSLFLSRALLAADTYDYIVIGGGPAGSALAAKLATSGSKVLLLERGKSMKEIPETMEVSGWPAVLNSEAAERIPQFSNGKPSSVALAPNVLGGGSSLNAGVAERESDDSPFWDAHPFLDKELRESAYKEVSAKIVKTRTQNMPFPLAAAKAIRSLDSENTGVTGELKAIHPNSVFANDGLRHSSQSLLEPNSSNLTVLTEAKVQRINFELSPVKAPRATSVTYLGRGSDHEVSANLTARGLGEQSGEIFLCAGAIHSPVILMKSGIGPKDQVHRLGAELILENEHVGAHLMDQPALPVAVPSVGHLSQSAVHTLAFSEDFHIETVNGGRIASEMLPRTLGILPAEQRTEKLGEWARQFVNFMPEGLLDSMNQTLTFVLIPNDTTSEGRISITEEGSPRIDYTPFANEKEVGTMYRGIKVLFDLIASEELREFRLHDQEDFFSRFQVSLTSKVAEILAGRSLGPGEIATFPLKPSDLGESERFKVWLQEMHVSGWHFTSTNRVGEDGVLDHHFRVKGTSGLRVVDASSLKRPPRINPQLTLMMLGNYVGEQVIQGK